MNLSTSLSKWLHMQPCIVWVVALESTQQMSFSTKPKPKPKPKPKHKLNFPNPLPNFHQNLILPNQSSIMAAESQPQLIVRSIHFICFPSLLFYFPCVGLNFQNETILFPTCLLLSTVLLWLVFFGMRVFYCSGFVYLSRVWIWLKFQDEILFAMFCLFI